MDGWISFGVAMPRANFFVAYSVFFGFIIFSSNIFADILVPKFEDYKVETLFSGGLSGSDGVGGKSIKYQGKAIRGRANFAGHYVVIDSGCGGGAICGEIVDALSGKVVWSFPNAYELNGSGDEFYDANFKSWSRLLIISGVSADPEVGSDGKTLLPGYRTRYYEFKDEKLSLIKIEEGR